MSPAGIFSQVLYEGASPRARGKHLPTHHCVMPFKSRPDDLCECLCDLGRLQVLPRQHENAIHQIADGGVLHERLLLCPGKSGWEVSGAQVFNDMLRGEEVLIETDEMLVLGDSEDRKKFIGGETLRPQCPKCYPFQFVVRIIAICQQRQQPCLGDVIAELTGGSSRADADDMLVRS